MAGPGPLLTWITRLPEQGRYVFTLGEAEAVEKLAEAAGVLSHQEQALQLRYLQTLTDIAGEKSSTIVFPLPLEP